LSYCSSKFIINPYDLLNKLLLSHILKKLYRIVKIEVKRIQILFIFLPTKTKELMKKYLILLVIAGMFACKNDSNTTAKNNTTIETPEETSEVAKQTSAPTTRTESTTQGSMGSAQGEGMGMGKGKSTTRANNGKGNISNFNSEGIPDACDLLSVETISKYVNVPAAQIFLNDGSSAQNPKSRACFFKWDGSSIKNAGVMVLVQTNPIADEVPDYLTHFVTSKKTEGEKDFSGGTMHKYLDWPGIGDDGAYSTELGKYIWRIGNDWAFMVAFNTTIEAKDQKKAAEVFANEVMANMVY